MQATKAKVFAFTYKEEGGYGNDPHDPGGATNLGIIQTEYNAYRQAKGWPAQSVKYITRAEADEIYTKSYWNKVDGDDLPAGVDLVIYDYAVNSGPSRSIKCAQRILGVGVDGIIGPITLGAIASADPAVFIRAFDAARLSFLRNLGTFVYFGQGWTARVKRATNAALELVGEAPKYPAHVAAAGASAPAAATAKTSTLATQPSTEKHAMLLDIVLGIARHVITGGGVGIAGATGFDTHNPSTWLGLAMFIGGAVMSGVDKAQKTGHVDALTLVTETLNAVSEKLDAQNQNKVV